MASHTQRPSVGEVSALARKQHWVVTHDQLVGLGLTAVAIRHRVRKGRLHTVARGVYVVGRRDLGACGRWMAAVLACGPEAVLSDDSAAALIGVRESAGPLVEVTVPPGCDRQRPGIRVHRRTLSEQEVTRYDGIPVTTPARTLLDLALKLQPSELEAAISAADRRGLTTPDELREACDGLFAGRPGTDRLRKVLDRRTFRVTASALERRFLRLVRRAGLPTPRTGVMVCSYEVDFFWPELGLIVETDGLRYHRTPAQQARDRERDQAHAAAGLTPLRFTHAQVTFEPDRVERTLADVARRLAHTGVR